MLLGPASCSPEDSPSRAVLLSTEWRIVAKQRYEDVWEYFSHVREAFVVKMLRFGERGVK